jgi:hypothetical protein
MTLFSRDLVVGDKIREGTLLFYVMILLTMVGTFDIVSEILNNSTTVFSQNYTKKIILWTIIYMQTKSIYYSSVIGICIVMLFPNIFFGKLTGPRLDKVAQEQENQRSEFNSFVK